VALMLNAKDNFIRVYDRLMQIVIINFHKKKTWLLYCCVESLRASELALVLSLPPSLGHETLSKFTNLRHPICTVFSLNVPRL